MKAARFHGQGDVRIEDIPRPIPNDGEVLIEVEWCGVCGTDLHEFTSGPFLIPRPDKPHVLTGEGMPVVLGHEFCGRVVEATEGSHLQGFVGLSGRGGGFSEFAAVDARMCYVLPDSVRLDDAALIEPLAVGRHALKMSGVDDFSNLSVLILGGGPIGLSVLRNLRAKGTGKVIVSEPSSIRRQHTQELADHVLNPLTSSIAEECRNLTGGVGVDVVFDCAGVIPGLSAGMDAVATRGTFVTVAGYEHPFTVPLNMVCPKEISIKFSMAYDGADYKAVVDDFIAGNFKGTENMITGRILLQDLVSKGLCELIDNKDHHIKIVASPKGKLVS